MAVKTIRQGGNGDTQGALPVPQDEDAPPQATAEDQMAEEQDYGRRVEANVATIEPAKLTIKEYRLDYYVRLSEEFQATEYREGVTVDISGGTQEERYEKYLNAKKNLMNRVHKTAHAGLDAILGRDQGK